MRRDRRRPAPERRSYDSNLPEKGVDPVRNDEHHQGYMLFVERKSLPEHPSEDMLNGYADANRDEENREAREKAQEALAATARKWGMAY